MLTQIPLTDEGMVDIRLYVYESTIDALQWIISKEGIIMREYENLSGIDRPFIWISKLGGSTDARWVRTQFFQIDVWSDTIEESEKIGDKVIKRFNRTNWKGIRSLLENEHPDSNDIKTGLYRRVLEFQFTFKDMNY